MNFTISEEMVGKEMKFVSLGSDGTRAGAIGMLDYTE
jgi:hypothetical protein